MTTPTEHAATVREALLRHAPIHEDGRVTEAEDLDALIALDALEAQAEAAQREADIQMGAKLAAQMTLKAVCDVLNLPMVSLGNGWTEATPKILARIETIVDEADRGFRERDAAEAERDRLREYGDEWEQRTKAEWEVTARLAAQVAELKAALEKIADAGTGIPDWRAMSDFARAALATDKEQA